MWGYQLQLLLGLAQWGLGRAQKSKWGNNGCCGLQLLPSPWKSLQWVDLWPDRFGPELSNHEPSSCHGSFSHRSGVARRGWGGLEARDWWRVGNCSPVASTWQPHPVLSPRHMFWEESDKLGDHHWGWLVGGGYCSWKCCFNQRVCEITFWLSV